MLWRSASELGQKYATKNYPSQGTPICRLNTAPAENLRKKAHKNPIPFQVFPLEEKKRKMSDEEKQSLNEI